MNDLSERVIKAAVDVHRALGPGLLEAAYEECLAFELIGRGFRVDRQRRLPLRYRDYVLDCAYRMDLVVQDALLVEVKAVDRLLAVHSRQLATYLRHSGLGAGLLMNFNAPALAVRRPR
jgi:GxxExxY protein